MTRIVFDFPVHTPLPTGSDMYGMLAVLDSTSIGNVESRPGLLSVLDQPYHPGGG